MFVASARALWASFCFRFRILSTKPHAKKVCNLCVYPKCVHKNDQSIKFKKYFFFFFFKNHIHNLTKKDCNCAEPSVQCICIIKIIYSRHTSPTSQTVPVPHPALSAQLVPASRAAAQQKQIQRCSLTVLTLVQNNVVASLSSCQSLSSLPSR